MAVAAVVVSASVTGSSNTVPEDGCSETIGHFILLVKQAHADTQALALARGRTRRFHKRCSVRPQGRCPSA